MSELFYRSDKAHFLGSEAIIRIRELSKALSDSSETPKLRVLVDLPDFVRVRAELGDLALEATSDPYSSIGCFVLFDREKEVPGYSPELTEKVEVSKKSLKSKVCNYLR